MIEDRWLRAYFDVSGSISTHYDQGCSPSGLTPREIYGQHNHGHFSYVIWSWNFYLHATKAHVAAIFIMKILRDRSRFLNSVLVSMVNCTDYNVFNQSPHIGLLWYQMIDYPYPCVLQPLDFLFHRMVNDMVILFLLGQYITIRYHLATASFDLTWLMTLLHDHIDVLSNLRL